MITGGGKDKVTRKTRLDIGGEGRWGGSLWVSGEE